MLAEYIIIDDHEKYQLFRCLSASTINMKLSTAYVNIPFTFMYIHYVIFIMSFEKWAWSGTSAAASQNGYKNFRVLRSSQRIPVVVQYLR